MKKVLSLLVVTTFVTYSNASYQSHPAKFKQVMDVFSGTSSAGQVRSGVVGAYKQVLEIMVNAQMMCKQKRAPMMTVKAEFEKPARAFLKNIESRMSKFKSMNADALLTPVQGILMEVLTSNKDFETMIDWAVQEMRMYLATIA